MNSQTNWKKTQLRISYKELMWKSVKLWCSSLEFIMQRQKGNVLSLSKGVGTQICCIIDSGGGRCACGSCLSCSCGACCCNGCSGRSACTCHRGCNDRCGNCGSTCTASAPWHFRDLTKSTGKINVSIGWVGFLLTTWDFSSTSQFFEKTLTFRWIP